FDEGFPQNQFAGVGNGPLVQEFFDKIGIEFGSNKSRLENQGGGVAITPFTMRGIANNVIGNKLNNNAAINANAFTAANFFAGSYVSSTDIIKITNPNVATPFIYYDADQKDIAGIHATIGNARVVYVTFPLEILNVSANQQEILRKSVNWLLTGSATSVDEELAEQSNDLLSVTMQPNPVSDRGIVNFSVKGITPQLLTISLYDALGNEVAKVSQGTFEPGNHSVNIPVSNFASGAYRLVVRSLEGSGVHIPVNIVR
ncbi:MAG: T9SS type A sorting domain-containing protein, partial [Ignavibacteria bacterium]